MKELDLVQHEIEHDAMGLEALIVALIRKYAPRYVHGGGSVVNQSSGGGSGAVDSVNGQTGVVVLDTDDIAEAANLYFTNERVDDRVAALLQQGSGITITYDDNANTLSIACTISQYTDEMAQDAIASLIQNGNGITWTYNDVANTLTANVSLSVFSTSDLAEGSNLYFTNERAQDAVGTIFTATETIQLTYNDAANEISASVRDDGITDEKIKSTADLLKTSLGITIDGGGAVITTGVKGYITVPFNCTLTGWDLFADQSGSIVIDVWRDTYANFPPTNADSLTNGHEPVLSSVQKNQDNDISDWTDVTLDAGDVLAFNVDSATTVTRVTLILKARKT